MKKRWIYQNMDWPKAQSLAAELGISPTLAALLIKRNISTAKEASAFLNPNLAKLHNPFLLPDIEKAVVRVRQAIDSKEKILVYGDRDVDGVTSIAVLVRTLKNLGADVVWSVPADEGYGLHKSILDKFAAQGVRLVITVDCGTSAVEEIDYAHQLGMQVIVTDHHLPPEKLPNAFAIVNPNLAHSTYPMKELAGCLTAFKFAYAIMFSFNKTFNQEYIVFDLETTGLSSPPDEIVEIGAILIRNFVPVKSFHTLVQPSIAISKQATAINGITQDMLKNSPMIHDVLPGLLNFIGNRTLVAHNAKFDLMFLKNAVQQNFQKEFINSSIDTLTLARSQFSFRTNTLGALAKELDIELTQAHRAIGDCMATAGLFQKITEAADPRLQFFLEDQLDLVTLGTIADIVPLREENRIVVKYGLSHLAATRKVGLRKLMDINAQKSNSKHLQSNLTSKDISWNITPLINAAGRFAKADLSVRLFLTEDEAEASDLVHQLIQLNQDRRDLQKTNIEKFTSLVQQQCNLKNDRILFVVANEIEHGVTGIIASQLMKEYQRPVILLISEGEEAMGSSRSLPTFNVVEALHQCKDLLNRYGGHAAAAGLSLKLENMETFREKIKKIAAEQISEELLVPQIEIDLNLNHQLIDKEFIYELGKLEPYGEANPLPIFSIKGATLLDLNIMGAQKNHLRLKISHKNKTLTAIGWNLAHWAPQLKKGDSVDIAFHLEFNYWENQEIPQLLILDLVSSSRIEEPLKSNIENKEIFSAN